MGERIRPDSFPYLCYDSGQKTFMLAYSIWIVGLVLELAILLRALPTRMYVRFPIFYSYMFCVFASSASLWHLYRSDYRAYTRLFWLSEFTTLILGYGVVLEIMHHAFRDYPGAERFARNAGFSAFGVIFVWLGISAVLHKLPIEITALGRRVDGFERDLRIVQAVFLAIVAALVLHYGIELGKNVRGLALGLGIYVAVSIVSTAFMVVFGARFQPIFGELQSVTYVFCSGIWLLALWSYAEVKNSSPNAQMESDYRRMVNRTREKLKALRSHFLPAVDA
jgi:Na+-transporting NADH:ubiquinone oxidoreductase subunit NqrE